MKIDSGTLTLSPSPLGRQEIVGDIWTGTRGSRSAPIMVIGEAYGDSERAAGRPFVGASGQELGRMLREGGLNEDDCFFTNLINVKPNANEFTQFLIPNDKGVRGQYDVRPTVQLQESLRKLDAQIEAVVPRLIIACGNWPLWYLTGKANIKTQDGYRVATGIDSWRGSQLYLSQERSAKAYCPPVLPVYHPAAIVRMWPWRRITVQDFRRASAFLRGEITWHDANAHKRTNIVAPKPREIASLLADWARTTDHPITCDIETKHNRIHIMGLSKDGKTNIAIPFFHLTATGLVPVYSPLDMRDMYMLLYNFFNTKGLKFIGQNFNFDTQFIARYFHKTIDCIHDCMVVQHAMWPTFRKSLDFMSSMYCEHHVYWKDDLKESSETYDTNMACLYNCEDLWRTREVYENQQSVMDQIGKRPQVERRMRLFPITNNMMNEGVLVDRKLRDKMRIELMATAHEIEKWLYSVMPANAIAGMKQDKTHWYHSPTQLATILYDRMKLRKTQFGRTTDKEALVELGEYYPHYSGLFSAILLLRSIGVVAANILSAKMENDNRLRTTYDLAKAITFRLTSSKNVWGGGANLQNIMRDREDMDLLDQDLI